MAIIEENAFQEREPKLTPEIEQSSNIWQSMSPRIAFVFGFVIAIAVSSVLALIFVLSILLRSTKI